MKHGKGPVAGDTVRCASSVDVFKTCRESQLKIADCGPLGIKTSLASAHLVIDPIEEEALSKLDAQFAALFHAQDFLEGEKAAAEGRKPVYQGE